MAAIATLIPAQNVANVMHWWADAGVDTLIDEAPVPWLERGRPAPRLPENTVAQKTAAPQERLPDNLDGFVGWLMSATTIPDAGPPARRVPPSGAAGAEIMVIIDMPEAGDAEAGNLIAGEVGALFDKMLGAIKRSRADIWLATLSPGRSPTGRLNPQSEARLAEIARHHIALVAPKRLWVMGETASRAILGMEMRAARDSLHNFNHEGGTVAVVASYHPRFLLQNPARKGQAWADMQMLIEGL